jgi:hypothetical protein
MAENLPVLKPGQALTLKASATITAGQLVAITGDDTIGPAGAASTAVVGVAGQDAAVNDSIVVWAGGVQNVLASGAVAAGSPVIAGAAGTVAASATPPAGQQVGICVRGGTGVLVRVQFGR